MVHERLPWLAPRVNVDCTVVVGAVWGMRSACEALSSRCVTKSRLGTPVLRSSCTLATHTHLHSDQSTSRFRPAAGLAHAAGSLPDTTTAMCPPSGPFYRVAGMSYVRYANLCADYLRAVMKEPFKSKALARQIVSFKSTAVSDSKQATPGETQRRGGASAARSRNSPGPRRAVATCAARARSDL
jgi:F-type H+-transporting ATPase subunit epsilon